MSLLATALFIDTPVSHMFIAIQPLWLRNLRHFLLWFSVCVCVYSATLDSSRVFFPLKYFPLQHFACHDVTDTIHHSITLVTLIYALKIFCWVNSVPYPNPPLPVLPTLLLSDGFILILRLYLLWVCNFSKQTLNQCKALLTKMVGS